VTGSTPDCLFTTQYAYDSADRVTSMTYPNGEVVTTGYNDAMEPVSLAGTSSYVSGATYNALGLLNGMNHGNTTATRLYYYGSNLEHTTAGNSSYGRLRRICVSVNANGCADDANAAGALFKMAYAYDAVGNITNMGDRTLGQGLAYSYDAQDRLASWSIGGTTQETYSYDVLGRMTNRSTLGTFSYGHASKVHAVTGVGAGTFSYDANGNMLSRWQSGTTFTHEWNADNKASRVHGGGQDIRYFYDADGVLVRRTSGGVTTVFVGPHAEWNSSTGWTNYYHFNGQRVAMRNSSGVFWLHGDHLGSASLITTNAGTTSGQLRYDPYGQRRVASGNIWTEYTFTDQRQELSVGLMDYDARMYSPLLARFISPDPIVPDKTNTLDFNRYAYVRHNPTRYTDPTGHEPKDNCSYAGVGCGTVYDLIQAGMQASTASQVVRWAPWFAPTLASWIRQGSVIASALHRSPETNEMAVRLLFQAGSAAGRHVLPSFNLAKKIQGMAGPGLGFEFSIGVNGNNPLSYFAFNLSISDGRIVMDTLGWSIAGVEYALGPQEFSLTLSNPFGVDLPGGYQVNTSIQSSVPVFFNGRYRSGVGTQSSISGEGLRLDGVYELNVNVGILFIDARDPQINTLPVPSIR
jgi:RHS repeat-associated protein